jgi:hypothetical protein
MSHIKSDQQPVKQSYHGTKTNNSNNNKDTAAPNFEDQATKARRKGGKKAARGCGKKPAATLYVTHTINGNCTIDHVLFPPHLEMTDIPPQENHAGLQS